MPYVNTDPATSRRVRTACFTGVLLCALVVLMVLGLVLCTAKTPVASTARPKPQAHAHTSLAAAESVAVSVARAVATGGPVGHAQVTPGLYAALTSPAAAPPIPTDAISVTATEVTQTPTVALFTVNVITTAAQELGGAPVAHGGATHVAVVHVVVSIAHSAAVVTALPGLVN